MPNNWDSGLQRLQAITDDRRHAQVAGWRSCGCVVVVALVAAVLCALAWWGLTMPAAGVSPW